MFFFDNVKKLAENITGAAETVVKAPFQKALGVFNENKFVSLKKQKNGHFKIEVKNKYLAFIPFISEVCIDVNPLNSLEFKAIDDCFNKLEASYLKKKTKKKRKRNLKKKIKKNKK